MPISCPRCGAQVDVTLFACGQRVRCACGARIDALAPPVGRAAPLPRNEALHARTLRRRADAITWTLLYSDLPRVDVEIAIQDLRAWVEQVLPDRAGLFERVYVARWRRLEEQGWTRERPDV